MANLIPSGDRQIYRDAISDVHDTFARNVIAWKHSVDRITNPDNDYDEFYNQGKTNVTYSYETGVYPARIKYIDRQEKEFSLALSSADLQVTSETQVVRLKFRAEVCQIIRDSEKVTVDGVDFYSITSPRFHGLFDNNYCTFYFRN